MKLKQEDIKGLLEKVKKLEKGEKLDLSSDEDLSIGVMNLIAIEEHLFFTAGKTGKSRYFDLLNEVRQMRKELMKKLLKNPEGEIWCISKHLLSASMRLMEVGTKALGKGQKAEAHDLFKKAYDLYNLFWAINLGMVKKGELKNIDLDPSEKPLKTENLLGKISTVIGKILDCCRE